LDDDELRIGTAVKGGNYKLIYSTTRTDALVE